MLLDEIKAGTTDYSVTIRVVDSTDGTPETSVAYNTTGVDLWYRRPGAAHTSITEATQTEAGAHSDGGFVHISDGYCRLDLPDAAVAAGVDYVDVGGTFTDMVVIGGRVRLKANTEEDVYDRVGAPAGASIAADLVAIEGQTDDIGAAGVGLTAVPWNSAWDAEVQSECADALAAYGPNTATPLDAAGVRTAVGLASANMDTQFTASATATGFATPTNITSAAGITLADDAITSAKYDETTAFPLAAAFSSTAIGNLEDMYDGTGYTDSETAPASRAQLAALSIGSAAVNVAAKASPDGFVLTAGTESANNEDSTTALDGTRHELTEDGTDSIDGYYKFTIGTDGLPTQVTITGVFRSGNDTFGIYVNTGTAASPSWQQRGTIDGTGSSSNVTHAFILFAGDAVSDTTDEVWVRVYGTSLSSCAFDVDQMFVSKSVVNRSVGYQDGAVWIDTVNGIAGTEPYVNGTADNPCSTWANAKTLLSSIGVSRIRVVNGSAITLDADSSDYHMVGEGWTLALGGQSIADAYFEGATVSGTSAGTGSHFKDCEITNSTAIAAAKFTNCGFSAVSGTPFAAVAGSGEYIFRGCYSKVAGSGTPYFDFSAATGAMGINNRGWFGGANYTLDTNCTLSHEVLAGGGTTVTPGDADVEIRGLCRSVTINLSDTDNGNTVQVIANTGPVSISAAASSDAATVNLYGTYSGLTDTSNGTVNDNMVGLTSINSEVDTAVAGIKAKTDQLTFTVANQVDSNVESINESTVIGVGTSGDKWRGA